jgi:threonine aldolase
LATPTSSPRHDDGESGWAAAAGLYALEHNLGRLADDHANARRLGERLSAAGVDVVEPPVPTNMVMVATTDSAADLAARAAELGIMVTVMGPRLLRCMTYLDIDSAQIDVAADVLCSLLAASDRVAPARHA